MEDVEDDETGRPKQNMKYESHRRDKIRIYTWKCMCMCARMITSKYRGVLDAR